MLSFTFFWIRVPEFIINVFLLTMFCWRNSQSLILHITFHYIFLLVTFFYSFSSYFGLHFDDSWLSLFPKCVRQMDFK